MKVDFVFNLLDYLLSVELTSVVVLLKCTTMPLHVVADSVLLMPRTETDGRYKAYKLSVWL